MNESDKALSERLKVHAYALRSETLRAAADACDHAASRIEALSARIKAAEDLLTTASGLNTAVYPSEVLQALAG